MVSTKYRIPTLLNIGPHILNIGNYTTKKFQAMKLGVSPSESTCKKCLGEE